MPLGDIVTVGEAGAHAGPLTVTVTPAPLASCEFVRIVTPAAGSVNVCPGSSTVSYALVKGSMSIR